MSLCLVYMNKDKAVISGDSRGSIEQNGEFYRLNDDAQKVFKIGDKIIFTSGVCLLIDPILEEFKNSDNQSIENLVQISKKTNIEKQNIYNSLFDESKRLLEMLIITFENRNAVIYNISSEQNFNILKYNGEKSNSLITIGTHTEKAGNVFKTYIENDGVYASIKQAYNSVADEQVGGILTIYEMTNDNIKKEQFDIHTSKKLKNLQRFNATDGMKISRNIGTANNPNWEDKLYADTNGNLIAEDLTANKLIIKNGTTTLINGDTRTIDFTGFNFIDGKENVIKGIDVKNDSGVSTFKVDTSGNVNMSGSLTITGGSGISNLTDAGALATKDSLGYGELTGSKPPTDADRTSTVINGGLITSGTIQLQDSNFNTKAGITAQGLGDSSVRIWAGDTISNRANAPFRVTQGGAVTASNITITGGSINISNSAKIGDNIYLGIAPSEVISNTYKNIYFNKMANIQGGHGAYGADIRINADTIEFVGTAVDFTNVNSVHGLTARFG
ncbi:hypothetical protein [Bacillus solitudinis]|uniref:hypothetical protein n=1 Tax=Bacillus solitudinis TaxID=2014074 RepID=UPI000C24B47D|nr:hypothetical protein [Bacillus solitudinis]